MRPARTMSRALRLISSSIRSARQAAVSRAAWESGSPMVAARNAALIAPTDVPVTMSIGTWRPSRLARSVRK
jgi:hypothetical protein